MPKQKPARTHETDSVFFLKLVVYLILGSFWVKLRSDSTQFALPLGLIAGVLISRHERLQIDRKIEYALLLVAAFISFWAPVGLFINLN